MKTAIVIGYTGQDGSYLAKLLLEKNYQVIGLTRNLDADNFRLDFLGIKENIQTFVLEDFEVNSLIKIINKIDPDEIYNLAAQSSVGKSFEHSAEKNDFKLLVVRFLGMLQFKNNQLRKTIH